MRPVASDGLTNLYKNAPFQKEAMRTQVALCFYEVKFVYRSSFVFEQTKHLNTQVEKSPLL